jgi:transmembrane sensor
MSRADLEEAEVDTMERQAAIWFARRRSGELTTEESWGLEAWLDTDPAHRDAFEAVERTWARIELSRDAPEIVAMRALARSRLAGARRQRTLGRLAAWGVSTSSFIRRDFPNQTFHTDVGQRSTVTLPDGSVVTLNTDTVLRTRADHDRRLLYLDRGQAFFKVAKDKAHPFVVAAAGRTVTAVGTAFDVRADGGRFQVTLVEGKVRVDTPLPVPKATPGQPRPAPSVQTTEIVAGSQFAALDETHWSVGRTDTAKETTWLTGWLRFENEPLSQVVDELDRYSDRKIEIGDKALADRPVTGRFKAGDVDAFVKALADYKIARVAGDSPGGVRLVTASE